MYLRDCINTRHSLILFLPAIFSTFNFADAVSSDPSRRKKNSARVEATKTEWLDGKARAGFSSDGIPIVYHIPGAISGPVHVSAQSLLKDLLSYLEYRTTLSPHL